jgi:hypothetical protein
MRDAGPPIELEGARDMRELPRRDIAGFFMAEEGTGIDVEALPSGPSDARVRRRESIAAGRVGYRQRGSGGPPMSRRDDESGGIIGGSFARVVIINKERPRGGRMDGWQKGVERARMELNR